MYFHTFKNDFSQQIVLTNYVTHEINMNSYQCLTESSCSNFTTLLIIMISTFSLNILSVMSVQMKTLTYKLFHVKQEQKSSIMKSVEILINKNSVSEFSKKFKIKNVSDFLISLFQIQTQTASDAQYQIFNDHFKKKVLSILRKK